YNHKHTIQKEEKSVAFANNDYNVFDYPLESPSHGNRTIVNSPYARFTPSRAGLGATNGWHHTSNTTNFTITRGNNVWAMEDVNANNGTGFSPDAGASLDFNYPYSLGATPAANQNTAITNLFYWNNLVHDVLYNYGFDEECGNFQQTNVDGAGGNGGDYVIADAQDGGGTNNANFSTPGDGTNGRMQMFLWSPQTSNTQLDVNPPSGIAGTYSAVESGFSTANKLSALGPITGDLVLANDIEACTANPITNGVAINGNIAVIDRGVCGFTEKVANAEAAGAIAVLVCNNVAGAAIIMGGTDNSITTPAVMLSLAECNTIKMAMSSNTVNITMTGGIAYTPDGDFDNGIVAHEYGHGWSTRATGGPGTSCLSGDEQQGEGWADFLALMLCTDWASLSPDVASANIPRGIGTYAQGQPISGGGIRPFQYSYDMAGVNSFVDYTNVGNATFTIPHGVGSMWCTMLWDMTWEIILQDNFIQTDIWDTSTLEGNVAAFKLVHEGLKLQPCAPGFVTSRDAILAADEELFNGKYKCSIWRAFARRGLGVDADQGSSVSVTDGTADYSLPGGVGVTKTANKLDFAQGETVTYTVTANCNCVDENNVTLEDILPSGLTYVAGSATAGGTESGGTITWGPVNLAANSATSYTYQATVNTGTESTPFVVVNDNLDGSAPAGFWTTSSDWTLTNNPTGPLAACSGNGYFAPDNATASDESLVLAFTLNGPATTLTFTHTYDTEADANGGWDGGIVEISTNSGTSWTDLGLNMTSNGYNTVSQSFGTPMFSGNSGGCISTSIDLAGYCGDIQVRFRMLCDAAEGGNGWLVDNIQVNSITGILNKADAIQSATSIGTGCACIEVTNIILPIELVEISATAEDKRVRLDWTTATETNNEGFQVERSTNPNNGFQKVGWVDGNGNTVSESNYEFDDANVRAGVLYYYRLKQMDFDEKYEYSQTVSARIKGKSEVVFYPNPAKNFVFIQSLETWTGQVTLTLRTIDGKTALRQIVDGQQLEQ
ncbi:MAG: M36 family metallopeptidase, partial [Saprospiraceae bacterium]